MLNTDVDPLGENPDSNTLVHNNTDSPGGDVVNATGPALVELVGHTLVDSTVNLDVNNIADLVGLHVGGEVDGPLGAEPLGEEVASARAVSLSVTHSAKKESMRMNLSIPWEKHNPIQSAECSSAHIQQQGITKDKERYSPAFLLCGGER